MVEIDFIAGGMMGDFIHALSAAKNICQRDTVRANIYISDNVNYGGDVWRFGVNKAYDDLKDLVIGQSYINKFEVLGNQNVPQLYNLNAWRSYIMTLYRKEGGFRRCWSDFMREAYAFNIPSEYKWLHVTADNQFRDKVVIHRSTHRHNNDFPWQNILSQIKEEILFVTSSQQEYESFQFKNDKIKLHLVPTISEMATVIGSCKYFIGNQSSPFALASSMDIPRLVELNLEASRFYMSEEKYSKNISWFLTNGEKHISENSLIKI